MVMTYANGKWSVREGSLTAVPRGASVTVKTPMKPKPKNLAKTKAKAKKFAKKHSASYTGVQRNDKLNKARIVVTWKTVK
jgi:hypothetical protein